MSRPRIFYRIISKMPLEKPQMIIGDIYQPPGFKMVYGEILTSRKAAKVERRRLRRCYPVGKHTLQEFTVEPGTEVRTAKGIVRVRGETANQNQIEDPLRPKSE